MATGFFTVYIIQAENLILSLSNKDSPVQEILAKRAPTLFPARVSLLCLMTYQNVYLVLINLCE